jgi:ABC-type transport system involved in cytochrome c biogenesis permease subunit
VAREFDAVTVQFLHWTAAAYLAAGLVAGLGLGLETRRIERASVALLAFGAFLHAISFGLLHMAENPPPVTSLLEACSFMAWVGTVFYLILLKRSRLQRLVVLVAPAAFLGAFLAALLPSSAPPAETATGWPHAHVLLASAGLSLLGFAGLAGVIFLFEHARLKSKKSLDRRFPLPSLEALDRVNAVSLAVGFLLLTLGVITGMIWLQTTKGRPWTGTAHEAWSLVAWVIYVALVYARFAANQGSRQLAISAVAGFAFLLFAVVGLELIL